jgi:hypothetical protein
MWSPVSRENRSNYRAFGPFLRRVAFSFQQGDLSDPYETVTGANGCKFALLDYEIPNAEITPGLLRINADVSLAERPGEAAYASVGTAPPR